MIVLLLVLPLFGALLGLATASRPGRQWALCLGVSAAWLASTVAALVDVVHHGPVSWMAAPWTPPVGISLVLDELSALLLVVVAAVGCAVLANLRPDPAAVGRRRHVLPLVQLLLWGVAGAFLTGDLFNLFVWFEVLLMASFVLLALDAGSRGGEGTVKYVTLNLLASALFLIGAGVLYGSAGTLNLADLGRVLDAQSVDHAPWTAGTGLGLACVLVAFLVKSAAFPLFNWLPASYHLCHPAVAALFAGLLTKVGVYACLRLTTAVAPIADTPVQPVLIGVAVLTMVTGVLGAATQMEMKRILAFHVISQVGYMLLAVALATPLALAAAVFYLVHHIVVKANLFLIAGLAQRWGGSDDVRRLGGLDARPLLTACALVAIFSLAGIPPLSGFFAKLGVVRASIDAGSTVGLVAALGTGFFTLYSMIKIHREAFLKPAPQAAVVAPDETATSAVAGAAPQRGDTAWALAGVGLLAALTLVVGLGAGPLWELCLQLGDRLADPGVYRAVVLAGGPS